MDTMILKEMQVPCRIGCSAEERASEQLLYIDVEIEFDLGPSAKDDDLSLTVDYVDVDRIVREVAKRQEYQLVETLVDVLSAEVKNIQRVDSVQVRVRKSPPGLGPLAYVEIATKK